MLDRLFRLIIDVRHRFKDHHINDYSATLAFFWFLAIFPTFVLLFAVMAWLGIDDALLIEQIEILIPGASVRDMLSVVYDVSGDINAGLISVGAVIAVWSASNGAARLVKLTVFAYGETEARSYIVRRLIGLLTLVAFSVGAVILIVFHIFGREFVELVYAWFPMLEEFERLATLARYTVSTVILIFAFSLFYKFAPQQHVKFTETLPGATFAVISWQLLSTAYSIYVDQFSMFGDTYGTIGIVILLQIWLYLTAATMLLGAEINAAWPDHMRRRPQRTHFP
ncbi:YihY/virulence factor BrkB family protein [Exiguobacterium sp. SH3S2]|uniref:YihY/virulence factor BrkB family protein n=1 Tax=unclassified Exiguobacterium TaxID=2644629 RepID=UPI00103AFE5C|nr:MULTISPECIES: YihY/virulence factor BrkB family protein [unclassified Exiguobacterium]TCI42014.1 YihY/virulence factor BrkB family protein [Exiguobacterium sp. SH3S3]TCI58316.1 YihY/virulence factor BrkB family protein [Exiguobacterium sp. SH3S2]